MNNYDYCYCCVATTFKAVFLPTEVAEHTPIDLLKVQAQGHSSGRMQLSYVSLARLQFKSVLKVFALDTNLLDIEQYLAKEPARQISGYDRAAGS